MELSERMVRVIKKMLNEDQRIRKERIDLDKNQLLFYDQLRLRYPYADDDQLYFIFENCWGRLSQPMVSSKSIEHKSLPRNVDSLLQKRKKDRLLEKKKRRSMRKNFF